jgi:hypothetical protein
MVVSAKTCTPRKDDDDDVDKKRLFPSAIKTRNITMALFEIIKSRFFRIKEEDDKIVKPIHNNIFMNLGYDREINGKEEKCSALSGVSYYNI